MSARGVTLWLTVVLAAAAPALDAHAAESAGEPSEATKGEGVEADSAQSASEPSEATKGAGAEADSAQSVGEPSDASDESTEPDPTPSAGESSNATEGGSGEAAEPDSAGSPQPGPSTAPGAPSHRRPRSRRTTELLDRPVCSGDDPRCAEVPWAPIGDEDRPAYLRSRSPAGAAVLGALVGFGTGFFYADDAVQGVAFSIIDGALWIATAATFIVFNETVVQNDIASGHSLARGDRPFESGEEGLYAAAWVLTGFIAGSHVYQAIGGALAASSSNETRAGFAIVPLPEGASMAIDLRF